MRSVLIAMLIVHLGARAARELMLAFVADPRHLHRVWLTRALQRDDNTGVARVSAALMAAFCLWAAIFVWGAW